MFVFGDGAGPGKFICHVHTQELHTQELHTAHCVNRGDVDVQGTLLLALPWTLAASLLTVSSVRLLGVHMADKLYWTPPPSRRI